MKKKTFYLLVFVVTFFTACGYKPISHYTTDQINGLVYVTSVTSLQDPRNSVILQDAITQMVVANLGLPITNDKAKADTVVTVSMGSLSLSALQYDTQGYVQLYRASVNITLHYKNQQNSGSVSSSGEYDFNVGGVTNISDTERFNAIKKATERALEEILGKLAVQSFKNDKR
ncbi:LPS assembly lipoprotein LptE [Arcobacter sp. FWKO B]|uniref:LPS assembly lipoprotein LptE n=1 Tax=Arcobacter sp. FWKO B TaxID=2593672 RepID=UPI0018A5B522|nr:LPS assembly lipoprotein LptE [Arcobacter sp. FWKO B]QOG12108.1 hypothetical protein FWKOB_05055 [Arcobacter sp. FWKO B]